MPIDSIIFPRDEELREIEPDFIAAETAVDPIFEDFPIVAENASILRWEQYDSVSGLQEIRGLNGEPPRVRRDGVNTFIAEPGVYGEFETIDEKYITDARPVGKLGSIDITQEVLRVQRKLVARDIQRKLYSIWQLLGKGKFSLKMPNDTIVDLAQYPIQTLGVSVPWGTIASATPLADLMSVQELATGSSCVFDANAKAYMNLNTWSKFSRNTNANDFAGKRTAGLASVVGVTETNLLLTGQNLPNIVINDSGYWDKGVFNKYIPDNKVIIVGRRLSGERIGEYRETRNANNPGMAPGAYVYVIDSANTGKPVPRLIDVHRGHNGGPVIFHPNGVVVMSVG